VSPARADTDFVKALAGSMGPGVLVLGEQRLETRIVLEWILERVCPEQRGRYGRRMDQEPFQLF